MQLKSVETTPNPNSMKLNLVESVGAAVTYTLQNLESCPPDIASLLYIEGVKSIFACNDFLTVNRDPRADWRVILNRATELLGGEATAIADIDSKSETPENSQIEVHVFVQTFRGIPIQVKAVGDNREARVSLGEKFNEAAQEEQRQSGADFLKERYWADHGVRYGTLEKVAEEVADELRGTYERTNVSKLKNELPNLETLRSWLNVDDWHQRLAAVQLLSLTEGAVPTLIGALKDENAQVRRLAAAALGSSGSHDAVATLMQTVIEDPSIAVRRTAGDALSDLGDAAAQPAMCKALSDANKLIRWRAARYLFDLGTAESLPSLEAAKDDREFEVRLEIEAAIARIRDGGQASGPAWKRILEGQ